MLGRAKHQAREEGRKCLRSTQAGNIPLAPRGEREREQSSPTLEGGSTKAMCASITTASRGSGRGRPGGLCSHPATRAISHSSNTLVTRGEREREQSSPTPEGGSTKVGRASITVPPRGSGRRRPGGLCRLPAAGARSHSSNTLVTRGERERKQSSPTPEGESTKAMRASITTPPRGSGRRGPGGLCTRPAARARFHSSNALVTRGERERE